MKTTATVLVIALAASAAAGAMCAYAVDPVRASWSGKAHPTLGVSEVLTVNFDLPITAALFCGTSGAGGDYQVSILTYPGDIKSGLDVV